MRYNSLLESLDKKIGSRMQVRRYNLSEIISESYKALYNCESGTNLHKLVESHLRDVRNNPKDIDRLSRQLCIVREVSRMTESGEISDKDLKAATASTYEGDVEKKVEKETEKRTTPTEEVNESARDEEIDDEDLLEADLTDEEVEELTKHLQEIRKNKKVTETQETADEEEKIDEVRDFEWDADLWAVVKDDGSYAGVPCLSWDEARELSYHEGSRIYKLILDEDQVNESTDKEELPIKETSKPRKLKRYSESSTRGEGEELEEGIFDSKEKKQKAYAEDIKKIFNKDAKVLANEIVKATTEVIEEVSDTIGEESDSVNLAKSIMKMINSAKSSINKTPQSLVKNIYSLGQKYSPNSTELDDIKEFISSLGKLQTSSKTGYKAMEYLFELINGSLDRELKRTIDFMKKEYGIVESASVQESTSYSDLDLSKFAKNSSSKAFVKTLKKLESKLKEGKALTRQESISLYKAANSAMTHLSVELEHNPEFLETFRESANLLSVDVDKLLRSMKEGKAPSKATMKSLAKFTEALLREDEDEEDLPPIEDEEDEFVSDEEGDITTEEEEDFDQEYADARVELHKELAEEHEGTEDPGVQEKLAQDAEEVANLPGITDEQIAELTGEDPVESGEEEDPEVEEGLLTPNINVNLDASGQSVGLLGGTGGSVDNASLDPKAKAEKSEEEDLDLGDEDDITDDELAELKRHLKEMRQQKKVSEGKEIFMCDAEGTPYVSKKEYEKMSKPEQDKLRKTMASSKAGGVGRYYDEWQELEKETTE